MLCHYRVMHFKNVYIMMKLLYANIDETIISIMGLTESSLTTIIKPFSFFTQS